MKKLLLAVSICAAAVAYAQDNGAAAQAAAPQNTGAAATQQAAVAQPQEKVAEPRHINQTGGNRGLCWPPAAGEGRSSVTLSKSTQEAVIKKACWRKSEKE